MRCSIQQHLVRAAIALPPPQTSPHTHIRADTRMYTHMHAHSLSCAHACPGVELCLPRPGCGVHCPQLRHDPSAHQPHLHHKDSAGLPSGGCGASANNARVQRLCQRYVECSTSTKCVRVPTKDVGAVPMRGDGCCSVLVTGAMRPPGSGHQPHACHPYTQAMQHAVRSPYLHQAPLHAVCSCAAHMSVNKAGGAEPLPPRFVAGPVRSACPLHAWAVAGGLCSSCAGW